ncbi:MAG: hypothetical protein ACR2OC_13210 [Solirubrobacterales bacterium]
MTKAPKTRNFLLALAATCAIGMATGPAANAATFTCPDFTVLHDDRIGKLQLPHGRYQVSATNLACSEASRQFARFLQIPSGNLPDGWSLNASSATFSRGSSSFRVKRQNGGGSGGGGTNGGADTGGRIVCPGTFRVLNNDRIGSLQIPAGNYRITARRISCQNASSQFTRFLQFPSGNLPDNWKVRSRTAKFRNLGTGESFRIKRVG